MWKKIKGFLGKFLPASSRTLHLQFQTMTKKYHADMNELKQRLNGLEETTKYVQSTANGIQKTTGQIHETVGEIHKKAGEILDTVGEIHKKGGEILDTVEEIHKRAGAINDTAGEIHDTAGEIHKRSEAIHDTAGEIQKIVERVKISSLDISRKVNEMLWADIFNSTIHNSEWLINKTFSPGRWAAGYAFLYILYRVLRDTRPKRILELGLGETTRVISQYASEHDDVEHFVVEHDPDWIAFFTNSFNLSKHTQIVQLPLIYQSYKETDTIRAYEGFAERFANGKYDLISVDGPQGGGLDGYSRVDVLSLLPDHLADSFSILVDDYNRKPEQNLVVDMLLKIEESGTSYTKCVYKGEKYTFIVCSEDKKFLTSL